MQKLNILLLRKRKKCIYRFIMQLMCFFCGKFLQYCAMHHTWNWCHIQINFFFLPVVVTTIYTLFFVVNSGERYQGYARHIFLTFQLGINERKFRHKYLLEERKKMKNDSSKYENVYLKQIIEHVSKSKKSNADELSTAPFFVGRSRGERNYLKQNVVAKKTFYDHWFVYFLWKWFKTTVSLWKYLKLRLDVHKNHEFYPFFHWINFLLF